MVRFLVGEGAKLEAFGSHYTPHLVDISPFCVASWHRRDEVAEFLLAAGAEITTHTAAYLGLLEVLEERLTDPTALLAPHPQTYFKHGKVWPKHHDYRPEDWATPLVYAVAGIQPDAVALLLERGSPAPASRARLLDFTRARMDRGPELVGLIAAALGVGEESVRGADAKAGDLVYLCRGDRGGNADQVRRLLRLGLDPNERNLRGQTPLHNAARGGLVPAAQALLEGGADPNAVDGEGQTPLHAAVRSKIRRYERLASVVRVLLDNGADPGVKDGTGVDVHDAVARASSEKRSVLSPLLSDG